MGRNRDTQSVKLYLLGWFPNLGCIKEKRVSNISGVVLRRNIYKENVSSREALIVSKSEEELSINNEFGCIEEGSSKRSLIARRN